MKNFFKTQLQLESLKYRQKNTDNILPLKLQAYERLALFTERISTDNLAFRLSSGNMDARSLGNAMLVAVQQEYEHNLSQQIYVSDKLWEIITLGKEQIQNVVNSALEATPENATAAQLMEYINRIKIDNNIDPVNQIRKAIKKEIQLIL